MKQARGLSPLKLMHRHTSISPQGGRLLFCLALLLLIIDPDWPTLDCSLPLYRFRSGSDPHFSSPNGAESACTYKFAGDLFAQTLPDRNDPDAVEAGVYAKPQQILQAEPIAALEADLAAPDPDYVDIYQRSAALLNSYYSQFIADKRILDQRRFEVYDPTRLDANTVRLLALARDQQYAQRHFRAEWPYLRRLHTSLGRALEGMDESQHALAQYAEAFRYAALPPVPMEQEALIVLPENIATTPVEIPIPTESNEDKQLLRLIESRYMYMLRTFADPDRIEQAADANQRQAAQEFRQTLEQYNELTPRLEEAERRVYVVAAEIARGQGGSVADAEAERDNLRAQKRNLLAILERIRTEAFADYVQQKRTQLGDLAFRMSTLIHRLESEQKMAERREHRESFARGIGNQLGINRTVLRDFPGYQIYLEFAHKIDPRNLNVLDQLAVEYRTSGRLERAIAFQEKFIELSRAAGSDPADLAVHYLRLGAMYSDRKDYLPAAEAYQQYLRDVDASNPTIREQRNQIALTLADIHFERTGRLNQAQELYTEYLNNNADDANLNALEQDTDTGQRERIQALADRFRIFKNLAAIASRQRRTDIESERLQQARESFDTMEAAYTQFRTRETELQNEIRERKQNLLNTEDQDAQDAYYRLVRRELPALQ
ncbi:MAG: hypothetical protein KDK34_06850, partial [Leptospiraceae bacterium]|nr:hypothetical protein [Leptospiraceae bacterium]